jgi:type VI secretion system protein ImpK
VTEDDPFFSGDAGPTVVRPMPGGRRPSAAPPPPPPRPPVAPMPMPSGGPLPSPLPAATGDNPLLACAIDLLSVAGQLRGSPAHPDPVGLRERLASQIRDFEQCARAKGMDDRTVLPARYVLCALIDESVRDTPWGSHSDWAERGLLIQFHGETWGGDKFYEALERLIVYPSGNLNILELLYYCIAMGFEGRYRVHDGGREELDRVRERLYQAIRSQRGQPEPELSPHWHGLKPQRDPLIHQLPLWVYSTLAAVLLLGLFAAYSFALGRDSDPVYLALAHLDKSLAPMAERKRAPIARPIVETTAPADTGPSAPPGPTLRSLLADQIPTRLDVANRPEGETIVLRGEGLFASAKATLEPAFEPLIRRIGEALKQLPGQVLVTGHTDSAPIKSLRFPSNWHLSQARAETVASLLAEITGQPKRFVAEGRADSELAVPDNPRDARNRRVEIMLKRPAATGEAGAQ